MRKLAGVLALAALALAPAAAAGGWATVGVSPLPSEDDSDWNVTLIVKQHGRTPLDGVQPTITIRNTGSGETKTFAAKPAGKPGTYTATVRFPSNGTWAYEVYDGFTQYGGAQTHTFKPVTIGGVGDDGSFPVATVTVAVAIALGLAGLLVLLARRRRPQPQVAPTH
jgi:MYXO-CTERM domain-containing protein